VFEVCYFQVGNPAGYVLHEPTDVLYKNILISTGPFIINTIFAFLIAFPAAIQFKLDEANFFDFILIYLGVSIGAHAFPSTGDASALWSSVVKAENSTFLTKVLVAPIVGFIYLGALGSFFWLDVLYGVGVSVGLPWLIIQFLA
jgi:hypothetical protein